MEGKNRRKGGKRKIKMEENRTEETKMRKGEERKRKIFPAFRRSKN